MQPLTGNPVCVRTPDVHAPDYVASRTQHTLACEGGVALAGRYVTIQKHVPQEDLQLYEIDIGIDYSLH